MTKPETSNSRRSNLACPYFLPLAKLESGNWPHPARLPLGCGWSGQCTAPGHENKVPAQDVLETFCNLGYAGGCAWSPRERRWDAVRFALLSTRPGDTGTRGSEKPCGTLRLSYICERDHRPAAHGELEFDLSESLWRSPHSDPRIQKMAECFLSACLRKQT
jgi:hypothetical protein